MTIMLTEEGAKRKFKKGVVLCGEAPMAISEFADSGNIHCEVLLTLTM